MSLLFGGGTGDVVDCGTATGLGNVDPQTFIGWFYVGTVSNSKTLFSKSANKALKFNGTGGNIEWIVTRTVNTDYLTNNTPLTKVQRWYCVAVTWASATTPTTHIYVGDLNSPMLECTYSTATDGSGSASSDSANSLKWGNNNAKTQAFQGRIGPCAMIATALTLDECRRWQVEHIRQVLSIGRLATLFSNTRGYWWLGYDSTGTTRDFSGNANPGVNTGCTQTADWVKQPGLLNTPWRDMFFSSGGTTFNQNVSVTATQTATIIKQANKILSLTSTETPTITNLVNTLLSLVTSTETPTVVKQVNKILGTVTGTGTASVIKQVGKILSVNSTGTSSLVKQCGKLLTLTSTEVSSLIKQVGKILSVTSTETPTVTAIKVILLTISTVTATGTASIVKQVGKILSVTSTGTAAVVKQVGKILSVTSTSTASVVKQCGKLLSLTATGTSSLVKQVGKTLSVTSTETPSLVKLVSKLVSVVSTGTAFLTTASGGAATAFIIFYSHARRTSLTSLRKVPQLVNRGRALVFKSKQ